MKSRKQLLFTESSSFPEQLRTLRLNAGLTHQTLADSAGLSTNIVSLLERGKTSPTMGTFFRIADALGVEPAELIESDKGHIHFALQRAEDRVPTCSHRGRYFYENTPFIPRAFHLQQIRPVHIHLYNAHFAPFLNAPIGDQCVYMLSGKIDYSYDDIPYTLTPGDALFFRGQMPRGPSKMYTDTAEYIIIFVAELFGWLDLSIDRLGRLARPPRTPEKLTREERVAWRIRYARLQINCPQCVLSTAAGLSRAAIGHVESGRTIPTLQTLIQIARALNVPVTYFFDQSDCPALVCHTHEKTRRFDRCIKPSCRETSFIEPPYGTPMFHAGIRRFTQDTFEPHVHKAEGQRYLHVLKGRLEFTYNGTPHLLKAGDSIYFNATSPHGVTCLDTHSVDVLWCRSTLRIAPE